MQQLAHFDSLKAACFPAHTAAELSIAASARFFLEQTRCDTRLLLMCASYFYGLRLTLTWLAGPQSQSEGLLIPDTLSVTDNSLYGMLRLPGTCSTLQTSGSHRDAQGL